VAEAGVEKEGADKRDPLARESGCEGARVSAADGRGRAGSGRGEGSASAREMGRLGREGGRKRGRERRIGLEMAQPRGRRFFLFLFLFLFLFFLFLLNHYLARYIFLSDKNIYVYSM
jgi:hypothetical protein